MTYSASARSPLSNAGGRTPLAQPAPEHSVLGLRRVYIIPTAMGWLYAAMLAVFLVGSINYALSLGYALTFLLAGTGVAAMVHTVRNIVRLRISAGRARPVFARGAAEFHIHLENDAHYERPAVLVQHALSAAQQVIDIAAHNAAEAILAVPTNKRGWQALDRIRIETRFPLGLFKAWGNVRLDTACLVYPAPLPSALPQTTPERDWGMAQAANAGSEDFSGLRAYQTSDSPRQVAWKAVARTDALHSKQFSGDSAAELWLDDALLSGTMDLEQRLSRLCGWVLAADHAGTRYGLRLPGTELAPDLGETHRAACLRALALHRLP